MFNITVYMGPGFCAFQSPLVFPIHVSYPRLAKVGVLLSKSRSRGTSLCIPFFSVSLLAAIVMLLG